jgi:hypothetical protein
MKPVLINRKNPPLPGNEGLDVPKHEVKNSELFLDREVSRAEYEEICRNLAGFFDLLQKWNQQAKSE